MLNCGGTSPNNNGGTKPNAANTPVKTAAPATTSGYEVVKSYPHDGKAFTQGLVINGGFLYESTGEYKESTLRKVDLATGKVLQKHDVPAEYFAEGMTILGDKIYQITWRERTAFVYNLADFKLERELSYSGEGWGLTNDGTNLIMSDGTHVLRFVDPATFKTVKTLPVMREDGKPLMQINELEWVKGEIWANIWHSEDPQVLGKTNHIARIDPATGKVLGWIDLSGISPDDQPKSPGDRYDDKTENVLNGIAYDAQNDRIFVTGKNWKKLYEIKITPPKGQ